MLSYGVQVVYFFCVFAVTRGARLCSRLVLEGQAGRIDHTKETGTAAVRREPVKRATRRLEQRAVAATVVCTRGNRIILRVEERMCLSPLLIASGALETRRPHRSTLHLAFQRRANSRHRRVCTPVAQRPLANQKAGRPTEPERVDERASTSAFVHIYLALEVATARPDSGPSSMAGEQQ